MESNKGRMSDEEFKIFKTAYSYARNLQWSIGDATSYAMRAIADAKLPPPLPTEAGAQEYELIAQGDRIWASIQKNSGT